MKKEDKKFDINDTCKNDTCLNKRRHGSAYCQECSDKHNSKK